MSVVTRWTNKDVLKWLGENDLTEYSSVFESQKIDGTTLLSLGENDLKEFLGFKIIGDIRRVINLINKMKPEVIHDSARPTSPTSPEPRRTSFPVIQQGRPSIDRIFSRDSLDIRGYSGASSWSTKKDVKNLLIPDLGWWNNSETEAWGSSFTKLFVSIAFLLFAIFTTSIVMTIVHERVPNPEKYLPLPDIILDNIDRIPIAFKLAEVCATILSIILAVNLLAHQHRMIIMRRLCAIVGTVFLLRCATMYITSLSVPGLHLTNCATTHMATWEAKLSAAWNITKGMGMSLAGVSTCGDYMFSGHTSVLTILNYFIIEYTPDHWKGLHIITWVLNIFGMFFILAAHEHYSIDVLIAFLVCDRVFQHYHTTANIHSAVSASTGIDLLNTNTYHLPLLSYLEEHTRGILPCEYGIPFYTWWKKTKQPFQKPSVK